MSEGKQQHSLIPLVSSALKHFGLPVDEIRLISEAHHLVFTDGKYFIKVGIDTSQATVNELMRGYFYSKLLSPFDLTANPLLSGPIHLPNGQLMVVTENAGHPISEIAVITRTEAIRFIDAWKVLLQKLKDSEKTISPNNLLGTVQLLREQNKVVLQHNPQLTLSKEIKYLRKIWLQFENENYWGANTNVQLVHGDFNLSNIVIDNQNKPRFIDFDNVQYAPPMLDMAGLIIHDLNHNDLRNLPLFIDLFKEYGFDYEVIRNMLKVQLLKGMLKDMSKQNRLGIQERLSRASRLPEIFNLADVINQYQL